MHRCSRLGLSATMFATLLGCGSSDSTAASDGQASDTQAQQGEGGPDAIGDGKRDATTMGIDASLADDRSTISNVDAARESGQSNDAGPQPSPEGGAGCGLAMRQTGDFHLQTVDGNGTSRDFEVLVPADYSPTTPLALTFVYHGAGETEAVAMEWGLQNAPGAANASIFVFPQGIDYQIYGVGWDDYCSGYDMVFFDNMVKMLEASYCIDDTSIFVAGFSWGCDFVTGLTCCRGKRIRGVGASSCSDDFGEAGSYKTYINEPCPESGFSAIRFTYDPAGDPGYSLQDFTSTRALYQSFNSCSTAEAATSVTPCVAYQGCSQPVVECPYPGLGHALPTSWAADTWSFFSGLR